MEIHQKIKKKSIIKEKVHTIIEVNLMNMIIINLIKYQRKKSIGSQNQETHLEIHRLCPLQYQLSHKSKGKAEKVIQVNLLILLLWMKKKLVRSKIYLIEFKKLSHFNKISQKIVKIINRLLIKVII